MHAPSAKIPVRALELALASVVALCTRAAGAPGDATVVPAGKTYVVAQHHPAAGDEGAGTRDRPFRTVGRAVQAAQAGDTVLIEEGVYREHVLVEKSGTPARPIRFLAAPMANVTVTGADLITEWTREEGEEGVFSAPWPHHFIGWTKRRAHPDDDYHLMVGRAEQVHVDGYSLLQVLSRAKLSRGTFAVDLEAKRLYICDRAGLDPVKDRLTVEASVRPSIWQVKADYVQLRGIRFRYAANNAQSAAVLLQGDGNVMEDCIVERVNGSGAVFIGKGITVRRCVFRDNGWTGFDATAQDFLMTGCLCENNNVKGWNRDWGAVNKLVLCRNAVIEKSIFRNNRGHGIWFDIGNESCTVRHCLIEGNENAGLFYEISYGLHAHDNVIIGNGLAPRHRAWGANGGISISNSPHCVVERNLILANKEGLQFRDMVRTTNTIGDPTNKQYAVWSYDEVIRNNVIAYNRDAQVAGWFVAPDVSHWPRSMQEAKLGKAPDAPAAPPPGTDLNRLEKKPTGFALPDLRIRFTGNLYAVRPGQRFYQWGCTWDAFEAYAGVAEVSKTLGFEEGSRIAPVEFRDWHTLDLRVPADSPLPALKCYPQGEVPGVILGVVRE